MTKGPHISHTWVDSLSRWGLSDWVAVVLETAGPLNILAAQVVYLVQPLLTSGAGRSSLDALAHLPAPSGPGSIPGSKPGSMPGAVPPTQMPKPAAPAAPPKASDFPGALKASDMPSASPGPVPGGNPMQ